MKKTNRMLSLFLAVVMVVCMLPTTVFASESGNIENINYVGFTSTVSWKAYDGAIGYQVKIFDSTTDNMVQSWNVYENNLNLSTVSIPSGSYYVVVIARDMEGEISNHTQSTVFTYTDKTPPTAAWVTAGTARTSDSDATVQFENKDLISACTYYYAVVDSGAAAPTIDTSAAGISAEKGSGNYINLTQLTAGAKDIYLILKDQDGNASEPIMTTIPAYVPPVTSFTVTFNMNGHGTAPENQTVAQGGKITKPADVPDSGSWKFGGWYKDAECVNPWDFDADVVTADTTLFAKWSLESIVITYTVTYDANGGTGTVTDSNAYAADENATVLAADGLTAPAGKEFDSWNTNADGTGTSYSPGDSITVTENITLHAQWVDKCTCNVHCTDALILETSCAFCKASGNPDDCKGTDTLEGGYFTYNGIIYHITDKYNHDVCVYNGADVSGNIVIPRQAFNGDVSYTVTEIDTSAFVNCTGLTSITIPDSVTEIDNQAFSACSELKSITIPNSVSRIGNNAFQNCTSLTSITIPSSVTSIGNDIFKDCTSLTSITIHSGVTSIGNSAFQGCTSLAGITIPGGVTSIGNSAFQGCTGLTSITIPGGVTSIGNSAFQGCNGLISITIQDGVTSIGNGAFSGCTGLASITLPSSVTSIGDSAFQNCSNLTNITIPDGVTTIGTAAFRYCTKLTSITIPGSVTTIDSSAFIFCNSLQTVLLMTDSPKTIADDAFSNTPATITHKYVAPSNLHWDGTTLRWDGLGTNYVRYEVKINPIDADSGIRPIAKTVYTTDHFYDFSGYISPGTYTVSVTAVLPEIIDIDEPDYQSSETVTLEEQRVPPRIEISNIVPVRAGVDSANISFVASMPGTMYYFVTDLIQQNPSIDTSGEGMAIKEGYNLFHPTLNAAIDPTQWQYVYVTFKTADGVLSEITRIDVVGTSRTTHRLTVTADEGGNIDPGSRYVEDGGSISFTITPDSGYKLDTLTLDGEDVTSAVVGNQYTLTNVTAAHTIQVSFKLDDSVAPLSAPTNLTWEGTTAKWDAVENASGYSVQLYKDGVAQGEPVTTTETEYTFPISESGSYTFKVKAIGDGSSYSDSGEAETDASAFYTVTFDMNGKDGTPPESQKVAVGGIATKPTDPTAAGFTFAGWYADKECTTAWDFDSTINQDTTLYAKWQESYHVQVGTVKLYEGEYTTDGKSTTTTKPESGGYAHYSNGVLTLHNFSYTGQGAPEKDVIHAAEALKVNVVGTNTITATGGSAMNFRKGYVIDGDGVLNLTGDLVCILGVSGRPSQIKNITLNATAAGQVLYYGEFSIENAKLILTSGNVGAGVQGDTVVIINSEIVSNAGIAATVGDMEVENSKIVVSEDIALAVNDGYAVKLIGGNITVSGNDEDGAIYVKGSTLTLPAVDYWWRTSADGEFTKNDFAYDEQSYIEITTTEPHTHAWDTQWSVGAEGHWHECTVTGCPITDNTQKDGYGAHNPDADDGNCETAVACTICNAVTTAAKAHSFTESTTKVASEGDCQNPKTYYAKCANCQQISNEITITSEEYGAHNWAPDWTTDSGKHWHKCLTSGCTEIKDENPHSGGSATCKDLAKCEFCDMAYGALSAHGKTEVKNVKDATCTEQGYTGDTYCKVCDQKIVYGTNTDALGHGKTEVKNAKDATCTEQGYTGDTYCKVCGEKVADGTPVAALGHGETEIRNAASASCGDEGYTGDKHCKACGETLETGTAIAKTEHNFKDGKCTYCKGADPKYTPDVPQTEENSHVVLWIILLIISAIVIIVLVVFFKRE